MKRCYKSVLAFPHENVRLCSPPPIPEIRTFSYLTHGHRNPRVSSWDIMCNPACCRSGRQRLAFSSTRKSLSPLIPVLPFAAQTVLRPRYYAGHAAQISKASGTQTHYVTTATVKGYFIKLKGSFMSPIETTLEKKPKNPF